MLSLLGELALMVLVPLALRHILSYFGKKEQKPPMTAEESAAAPPRTQFDRYLHWLLLSASLWNLYHAFIDRPVNLFDVIGAPYDCPNYQLRNRFRTQIATEGIDSFPQIHSRVLPRGNPATDASSVDDVTVDLLEWWTALFEQLKISDNRHAYLHYGHQSFVDCYWCRSPNDYALYTVPSILMTYVVGLALLGLASQLPTKRFWGTTLVWLVLGVMSTDLSSLTMPVEYMQELLDVNTVRQICMSSTMHMVRHLCLGVILFVVWLVSRQQVKSEQEMLMDYLRGEDEFIATMKALQLQRMAVLDDEELLRRFVSYHKLRQAERALLMQDPAVQAVRERALNRVNMSHVIQSLHEFSAQQSDARIL
jgi:hypothetical protein